MGHTDGGGGGRAALETIEKARFADLLESTRCVDAGEAIFQKVLEFFKFREIRQAFVVVRNGFAADHIHHVLHDLFLIQGNRFRGNGGSFLRTEPDGAI